MPSKKATQILALQIRKSKEFIIYVNISITHIPTQKGILSTIVQNMQTYIHCYFVCFGRQFKILILYPFIF
jgi:hypothetical protein